MPQATAYDAIVIGTGQDDRFLPIALTKASRNVAVIERDHRGGSSVNVGRPPTKTMNASARLAYQARHGTKYGIHIGSVSVDLQAICQRKQGIVEGTRNGYQNRLTAAQGHNLDLLRGQAHLTAPRTLKVSHQEGGEITAPLIVIGTRTRPAPLATKGVERVPVLNSTTLMELDTLPEHLHILGGSYIGLEFGQMFRRFGNQVTIIQRRPRLLMDENEEVPDEITRIFSRGGITVLTGTTPQQMANLPMTAVSRTLETSETCGFMKGIGDADTQHILGCSILSIEGGEIMTIIQVAMMGKLPHTALKKGRHLHPSAPGGWVKMPGL